MIRGSEHLVDLPLPGSPGGISHSSFILSETAVNAANGYALLASSHRNARHPFGFFVDQSAYQPEASNQRPFDVNRPIGVEQLQFVEPATLPARVGTLTGAAFGGGAGTKNYDAHSAIRVQFALPGFETDLRKLYGCNTRDFSGDTDAIRGSYDQFSVWKCRYAAGTGHCVIASNDKHNRNADHVQALRICAPASNELAFALTDANHTTSLPSDQGLGITGRVELLLKQAHTTHASLQHRMGTLTGGAYQELFQLFDKLFGLSGANEHAS